jgi:hypothetical protein
VDRERKDRADNEQTNSGSYTHASTVAPNDAGGKGWRIG